MYVLPLLCCAHNTMCFCVARIWESRDHGTLFLLRARARRRRLFFCVARIWESRDHGTLYFLLCAYGSPAIMAPYIFFAFLRCAHMGVPRSWHPIFFAFLRCAHMGVPRSWHPIFLFRARGGGGRKRNAFRSRAVWGSFTQLNKRVLYYKRGVSKKSNFGNLTQSGRTCQPD